MHSPLAEMMRGLDPCLEDEVARVKVGPSIMIPLVIISVHSSNDGIGGGIRNGGEASGTTSPRMINVGHPRNHVAMKVAVCPVSSLEVSGHGDKGGKLGMMSFPLGIRFFYNPLIVPLVSFFSLVPIALICRTDLTFIIRIRTDHCSLVWLLFFLFVQLYSCDRHILLTV